MAGLDDPSTLPKLSCAQVHFSTAYPVRESNPQNPAPKADAYASSANGACHEVVMLGQWETHQQVTPALMPLAQHFARTSRKERSVPHTGFEPVSS